MNGFTPDQDSTLSRRRFLALGGLGVVGGTVARPFNATGSQSAPTPEASPPPRRIEYNMPVLEFESSATQSNLGVIYDWALTGLIAMNTVFADPDVYNPSGLLNYPPGAFVQAGGGYPPPQRWTRDCAVNAWNAVSLLSSNLGWNTLFTPVNLESDGTLIVQQGDGEWWDNIVWVNSAWNHYCITGDIEFLTDAYQVSVNTLGVHLAQNFNSTYGLFQGPAFMNDGIAGYPSPPWDPGINSSSVLAYPGVDTLMCLSTNCLYYGAYRSLAQMAAQLKRSQSEIDGHEKREQKLREAINKWFWLPNEGRYGYLIHGNDSMSGQLDLSQEGSGLAFTILLGIASDTQVQAVLQNAHWQPYGIVDVYPNFPRFSDAQPGRHNKVVWPMIHSMFGHAAAAGGRVNLFERAVTDLATLVRGSSNHFYEIYNSITGTVDGGYQTGESGEWTSQPDQAWSQTGYLRMIYSGLFGLQFSPGSLAFKPTLPAQWGPVQLRGLPYRNATLDIQLSGAGNRVTKCTIDGRHGIPVIPSHTEGYHTVSITLS